MKNAPAKMICRRIFLFTRKVRLLLFAFRMFIQSVLYNSTINLVLNTRIVKIIYN